MGIFFREKCFSCHTLLIVQISLSNCLHFLRCWEICVLQLFVFKAMTSWFFWRQKSEGKNLSILRTKGAFKVKQKAFFLFFKGLSDARNWFRHGSGSLKKNKYAIQYDGEELWEKLRESWVFPKRIGKGSQSASKSLILLLWRNYGSPYF